MANEMYMLDELKKLWDQYQLGQVSCDHTAKEVFFEVLTPLLFKVERLENRVTELEPAAECWDALCKCYRITCMGWAGLPPAVPRENGYAHATFNLWTIKPGFEPEDSQDEQSRHGALKLAEFMTIAIKNHPLKKA